MPALTIRLKKNTDGTAAHACSREDGTVTWQRHSAATSHFFPLHDLTHYAVETVLGHRRGFYGLVAEGWDLTDFGRPWPRGPLPPDMDPSELIVGFLDVQRAVRGDWSREEFNAQVNQFYAAQGLESAPSLVSESQWAALLERLQDLFSRWFALEPGETLVLTFPPARDVPGRADPRSSKAARRRGDTRRSVAHAAG